MLLTHTDVVICARSCRWGNADVESMIGIAKQYKRNNAEQWLNALLQQRRNE
jgi:hypothetical protein